MQMTTTTRREAGFTLLETVVALGILAIALVGAFAGIVHASSGLREGQLRQYKMLLVDAKAQQMTLGDKSWLALSALPIDRARWNFDTSPLLVDPITGTPDLATSAYFKILPNGQIVPVPVAPGTACNDSSIPDGTYCRELLIVQGTPDGGTGPGGAAAFTVSIRIARKGELASNAAVVQKVLIP